MFEGTDKTKKMAACQYLFKDENDNNDESFYCSPYICLKFPTISKENIGMKILGSQKNKSKKHHLKTCNEAQHEKEVVFYFIMRTGIRQDSRLKEKNLAMRKETWSNYKNINRYSYKTSHSIYMETDKD